jgi:hypothetical protein
MILIGTPHTRNAGYYLNDDPNGKKREADIQTCWHCQRVIKMHEWKQDGAFCRGCMHPICGPCGDQMLLFGCVPFLKKLDLFTDAVVKYQQHLKVAGLDPVNPPSIIISGL